MIENNNSGSSVNILDAIFERRSVHAYLPQKIEKTTIEELLHAAIQAPTARHEEAYSFIVIQNKDMLKRISDSAKVITNTEVENIFYNAGTLIAICAKFSGKFVEADCWLATENLLLAAYGKGLGTCVIGLALDALNSSEWKKELNIPDHTKVVAPIIIGIPAGETPHTTRNPPEIITWVE